MSKSMENDKKIVSFARDEDLRTGSLPDLCDQFYDSMPEII